MSNLLSRMKALPKGALIVLVLMSSSFLVGGALVYIGLTVPADVTVTDPTIEVAMFSASPVGPYHFGDVRLNNETDVLSVIVTNVTPTARVLHVSATGLGTGLTLSVLLNDGITAYVPISLAPAQSITLKMKILASGSPTLGLDPFNVVFN